MKLDYLILALKNLRHRGIRSWLTLLGIFIGVTAVVALIGLGNGLQAAVGAQFGISSTQVLTVQAGGVNAFGPPGSGALDKLTFDDVNAVEGLSSVEMAVPRMITSGKMEFNDVVAFGMAISVPDGEGRKFTYEVLDLDAEVGRMLKDGDVGKVILGYNFWRNGDIFGKAIVPGKSVLIQDEKFTVVGIVEKTGSFMIDSMVMINEDDFIDLMDYGEDVDIIAVKARSEDEMERTRTDIEKLMRRRRDVKEGNEDFEVSTPEAMMDTVNSVLGGVQAFIIIIASISILVGALGLIGGLVGIVLGTLISVAGIVGINSFIGAELTPVIDFVLIGGALVGSFVVGAAAGVVPAMNAAKQDPVEALRG